MCRPAAGIDHPSAMTQAGGQLCREELEVLADSKLDRASSETRQQRQPTVSMAASAGAQPGDRDSGCPPLLHTAPGVLPMALTHSSTRKMLINSSSAEGHQIGQFWGRLRKRNLFSLGQRWLQRTQQAHGAYREGTEKSEPGSKVYNK